METSTYGYAVVPDSEADRSIRLRACRYFFFVGALAAVPFGVVAQDRTSAGEATFFGCFGFFDSRLPRA
jgi:hypothetical protein